MAIALSQSLEAFTNLAFPKSHTFTNGRLKKWIRDLAKLEKKVVEIAKNPLGKNEQILQMPLEMKVMRSELDAIQKRSSHYREFIAYCDQYFSSLEELFVALLEEVDNSLITALNHFMNLPFPRGEEYYCDPKLEDWLFELPELEGYVVGIVLNTSSNLHFLPKLPLQMKEKRDELETIQPADPSSEKLKIICGEYFAALERVVDELLKSKNG